MNRISRLTKKIGVIATYTLLIIIQTSFASCSGNYGKLKPSFDVTRMFEDHKILTDHSYYYSGPDAKPDAIIGIHDSYTLNSRLWKPVDLTPKQLKNWINFISSDTGYSFRHYGSLILDPTGKQVGVWYSPWDWTIVRMENDNHIVVHTPRKTVYRPLILILPFWGSGHND